MTSETREKRIASLTSIGYCVATATQMVDRTNALSDEDWQAHADFLASKRVGHQKGEGEGGGALGGGRHRLPAPPAQLPAEAVREKVQADIAAYMEEVVFATDSGDHAARARGTQEQAGRAVPADYLPFEDE